MIKRRWLVEALTWKISSTIIGFLCVWFLAHDVTMGIAYMAIYTPLSTIWYIAHKKLWSIWKNNKFNPSEVLEGIEEEEVDL